MEDRKLRCSRRKFLARAAAALTLSSGLPRSEAAAAPAPAAVRRPLALLCTVYRPLSYAWHLAARFLHGYPRAGRLHVPDYSISSLCALQAPDNDLSRELARGHGVRVARSIAEALTADGSTLAVEGVLLVGEHGNYPRNDRGQILYPRYEMLEQVVAVFRHTGRSVPVYGAKHLSHDPVRARQMAAWAEKLGFPLMSGGYLPLTWRRPELELPLDTPVEEALVAGYGPVEVFGFHALEALQTMMERRRGGETGVRAVTCLMGRDVWRAAEEGRWSRDLLAAALSRSETAAPGDVSRNAGRLAVPGMPATPPVAFLLEYGDGARGTALLLNGHVQDFTFAAQIQRESQPASCLFALPASPGCRHFDCLADGIEQFLWTRQSAYPVQRALLTAGTLAAGMESHYRRGTRVETPDLDLCYSAPAESGFRRGPISG